MRALIFFLLFHEFFHCTWPAAAHITIDNMEPLKLFYVFKLCFSFFSTAWKNNYRKTIFFERSDLLSCGNFSGSLSSGISFSANCKNSGF